MGNTKSDDQTLLNSIVGQAAAGITLAASFIYGAGALTVALRLYFTRLSWESVLGQLPHDLIITTGFGQIVLPAIVIGILGAILLNYLTNTRSVAGPKSLAAKYLAAEPGLLHFIAWLIIALVVGTAESAISLYNYNHHRERQKVSFIDGTVFHHFTISLLNYFLVVGALCSLASGVALIMLPKPRKASHPTGSAESPAASRESRLSDWQWTALVGALIAFAVTPCLAAISASTLFPYAVACSPRFQDKQLRGDIIATDADHAYMVRYFYTTTTKQRKIEKILHPSFAIVSLSSVQLVNIGLITCEALAP